MKLWVGVSRVANVEMLTGIVDNGVEALIKEVGEEREIGAVALGSGADFGLGCWLAVVQKHGSQVFLLRSF